MKNKEKYAKEIAEIAAYGQSIAKVKGKIVECESTMCERCDFIDKNTGDCLDNIKKWAEAEYKTNESCKVEWGEVPIDTRIIIHRNGYEHKRYFAGVIKDAESDEVTAVKCFKNGRTSWSSEKRNANGDTLAFVPEDVKLARKEDREKYRGWG